jgi:GxxExxY protein
MDIEKIGKDIVHCAIKVHKTLGPGLLESVYQKCLAYELEQHGHKVLCELYLPIEYGPITLDEGYRVDMLVDDLVLVENKVKEEILPIHEAQLLTYLKMKKLSLGYLLNWNVPVMKQGIKRMANNHPETWNKE